MIKDKDGKVIGTRNRSRGNVFQLNPTKMTCLLPKLEDGCGIEFFVTYTLITL